MSITSIGRVTTSAIQLGGSIRKDSKTNELYVDRYAQSNFDKMNGCVLVLDLALETLRRKELSSLTELENAARSEIIEKVTEYATEIVLNGSKNPLAKIIGSKLLSLKLGGNIPEAVCSKLPKEFVAFVEANHLHNVLKSARLRFDVDSKGSPLFNIIDATGKKHTLSWNALSWETSSKKRIFTGVSTEGESVSFTTDLKFKLPAGVLANHEGIHLAPSFLFPLDSVFTGSTEPMVRLCVARDIKLSSITGAQLNAHAYLEFTDGEKRYSVGKLGDADCSLSPKCVSTAGHIARAALQMPDPHSHLPERRFSKEFFDIKVTHEQIERLKAFLDREHDSDEIKYFTITHSNCAGFVKRALREMDIEVDGTYSAIEWVSHFLFENLPRCVQHLITRIGNIYKNRVSELTRQRLAIAVAPIYYFLSVSIGIITKLLSNGGTERGSSWIEVFRGRATITHPNAILEELGGARCRAHG